MKHVLVAALVWSSCLGAASAFAAMPGPAPAASAPSIVLVDGGCGPGGFRDRFGYCRPKGYVYRRCPFGFHLTPYGCRPNY